MNVHPMVGQALAAHRYTSRSRIGPELTVEDVRKAWDGPGLLPRDSESRAKVLAVWPELGSIEAAGCGGAGARDGVEPNDPTEGSRRSLRALFEAFWPVSLPFPPRYPWVVGVVPRDQILQLFFSIGASSTIRSARLAMRKKDGAWGGAARGEERADFAEGVDFYCPGTYCTYRGALTALASAWCDAGGNAKAIVEILYHLIGMEFCQSGACEDLEDTHLTNCRYADSGVYSINSRWFYSIFCCCQKSDGGPWLPGPGPGLDPDPWEYDDDDDDDTRDFESF